MAKPPQSKEKEEPKAEAAEGSKQPVQAETAKQEVKTAGSTEKTAEKPADKKAEEAKAETPENKAPIKKKSGKEIKPVKLDFLANMGIAEEKEYFIENFAMLLSSGTDIISAIEAIKTGLKSPGMIKVTNYIEEEVNSGSPLWEALSKTNMLPKHIVTLIRIGEETGRLSENLKVVVQQQQKERSFQSKIKSALMYPVLILSLTLIIGVGIAWFVLPKLSVVFQELNVELPAVTKAMIAFGQFMSVNGVVVVPVFFTVLGLIFYIVFGHPKTRIIGEFLLTHFPVAKDLIKEVELGRMGFILGTLLDAGLPIVAALKSLTQSTGYFAHKKLYTFLQEQIEEGKSFQISFNIYKGAKKIIPIPIQQMIVASEQSGRLAETLLNIGKTFEDKAEDTTKNLAVLLEPIMLVFVWLGVIGVAIGVVLPIYSLVGQFKTF